MARLANVEERKRETRSKIQLGGLVIKAGLRDHDKALILGALIDAAERIRDQAEAARLLAIGKASFRNDTEKIDGTPRSGDLDAGDRNPSQP